MTSPDPEPSAVDVRPEGFRVLGAEDPAQRAEWLRLWERWPDAEVMAHPEFGRLFARPGDQVVAATYAGATGGVLYPLILRPLRLEPWAPADRDLCDLTTPYGYGGPFAWGVSPEEAADFGRRLADWARARGVVTAFARLSLFSDQLLPFDGETIVNGPNVLRRLDLSDEELWNDYDPKVRQNVRRARFRGCTLRIDEKGDGLGDFHRVYTSTMERRNADARYFFGLDFFESIVRNLPGCFTFFHVIHAGRVVSSELVLLSRRHAYFFLGGSLAEAFEVRPNDLLQHETFLWCRNVGMRAIVLGGGYKGSEGLLRYKKSFAPHGEVSFFVGMKTYDAGAAEELVESRRRWEARQGRGWSPEPGYFPAYRSEPAEQQRQAA
jgi:hypothetical protein